MRGYFSYLLVIAALSLLVLPFVFQARTGLSEQLAMEKTYQAGMNGKELVFEGVKRGIINGLAIAAAEKMTDKEKIKEAVKLSVSAELAKLYFIDNIDGVEVSFWCGSMNEAEKGELRKKMLEEQAVLSCDTVSCQKIPACSSMVEVHDDLSVSLGAPVDLIRQGNVWVSAYYENVAYVSKIPEIKVYI